MPTENRDKQMDVMDERIVGLTFCKHILLMPTLGIEHLKNEAFERQMRSGSTA